MGNTSLIEEYRTMSPSLKLNFVPLLLLLGFAGITSATPFFFNNLLVSTVSLTQTVTETTTTKAVCAELVNVTNACNARNGRWLRVPEILTFDDGLEVIDHYLNPSVPYRIVPTIFHEEMPRTPFLESGHVNVYNPEPIQARIF